MNRKKLYAILWIDDFTSFPLSSDRIQWLEQNAVPLSLGIEMDRRFPAPFTLQLKQLRRDNGRPSHYLFHHYHPARFKAAHRLKSIYDFLRLRRYISALLRILGMLQSFKHNTKGETGPKKQLKLLGTVVSLLSLVIILYLGIWQSTTFWLLLIPYSIIAGITLLIFYVNRSHYWQHEFTDWEWNKQFLNELKTILNRKGQRYPPVTRHGLNTPPTSSMEFYLNDMQVLADASATPTHIEGNSGRGSRRLYWRIIQPYYASLSGDYDKQWDGLDEMDRGVLELPVNLGNIAQHGFGEVERRRIEQLPDSGLVSAFMHAWDDFTGIQEWVSYLNENYHVSFLRADEYAGIYMKQHPRPVLIDRNLKTFWALKRVDRLKDIREIDDNTISIRLQNSEDGSKQAILEVATETPVPEIYIDSLWLDASEPPIELDIKNGGTLLKEVQKGSYHLHIQNDTFGIRNSPNE